MGVANGFNLRPARRPLTGRLEFMSGLHDPFDPTRVLRSGCGCGRHGSQAEHDAQAQAQPFCAPADTEEARYAGMVAAAVMRAMVPRAPARRAFLQAVGASTALAALAHCFPLRLATEA